MPKDDRTSAQARAKDRQSRSGKDDTAKKGGKGGAYTWEGDGSEATAVVDKGDPNYAEDEDPLDFFDAHFHVWDLTKAAGGDATASGHDAGILFAPDGEPCYGHARYEAHLRNSCGVRAVGGAYVEAMSVCFPGMDGVALNDKCLEEARWTVAELGRSPRAAGYVVVLSAALEAANAQATLDQIAAIPSARGIRQIVNFQPDWPRNGQLGGDLLQNPAFRAGFASLAGGDAAPGASKGRRPLSFDLQLNPPQYGAAAELIRANPGVRVIVNHLGCVTLADLTEPAKASVVWDGMAALAACPNVVGVKLSMLCYTHADWPTCDAVVAAVHRVIELFGEDRCFFSSNYPVDVKDGWPADRLLPAFRQLASRYPADVQRKLFSLNARAAYGASGA
eukprot:g2146.t1